MKFVSAAVLLAGACNAFVPGSPKASFVVSPLAEVKSTQLYADKTPFFAAEESPEAAPESLNEMTEEEEIDLLVEQEMKKTVKVSKLKTKAGVDYAPWMNVSSDDEKKIRQLMKEKAAARRKRELEEQSVSGNLYLDSQAQELSGTGLKNNVIDGKVELEWATMEERETQGFIVRRRPAKTDDFSVIASFQDWGPLVSQGVSGGVYRYFDESVTPGGWVYRVSEVDSNGSENDLCQCLVEIQTEEEQRAGLIAGVGIGVFAVGALVAGVLLDPMGGY